MREKAIKGKRESKGGGNERERRSQRRGEEKLGKRENG